MTYMDRLREELDECESVLDLGCGGSSPLKNFKVSRSLGVDAWAPALDEAEAAGTHTAYLLGDIRQIEIAETFDVVLMVEVLEHMTTEEGRNLLRRAAGWASLKIILTTPKGFLDTGDIPEGHNPYLRHIVGWTEETLKAEGFEVTVFPEAYGLPGVDMLFAVRRLK